MKQRAFEIPADVFAALPQKAADISEAISAAVAPTPSLFAKATDKKLHGREVIEW
ncbi:MAG: hypothetical protein ABI273_14935 [Lacunisphaera sp.]